jgi:hypothetical protein
VAESLVQAICIQHAHASFSVLSSSQVIKNIHNPHYSFTELKTKRMRILQNAAKLKIPYLAFQAILRLSHAEGYFSAPQTPLTAKTSVLHKCPAQAWW